MNKVYEDWAEWVDVDKAPRTAHEYKGIIRFYIKDAGIKSLDKVTPKHLSNWINKKGKAGLNRRRLILAVVKSFHRYAHDMGFTNINPASIVKVKTDNLTHKQKESKRVEAFLEIEVEMLVQYLCQELIRLSAVWKKDLGKGSQYNGERKYMRQRTLNKQISECHFFKAAILLSYETGLRLSDVCQLEWDCIEGDQIVVHTDKRDKRVAIPMWNAVKSAVNAIPERSDDEELYCFPRQNEIYNTPNRRSSVSNAFLRIMREAGITRKGLSFHSLRHACLSKWSSGGLDLDHIQKLAGHSSTVTTKGYIHNQ